MALYYCEQYSHKYDVLYWINADSDLSIHESFLNIAHELKIQTNDENGKQIDIKDLIQNIYKHHWQKQILIIFDDLQNEEQISFFYPHSNPHSVKCLITSQSDRWSSDIIKHTLNTFTEEISREFLKENIPLEPDDYKHVKEIVTKVQGLPLALQLIIAYIKKHKISTADYNKLLDENSNQLIIKDFDARCGRTVNACFQIAIHKIRENENNFVLKLLYTMSMMDGKKMERNLLLRLVNEINDFSVEEALQVLEGYSLIKIILTFIQCIH